MRGNSSGQGYNSLRDVHLAHYFSRADVLRHLVHMGLVTRSGEVVPESEWRRLYFKEQREAREREKEEHRRRLQDAEDAAKRRIKAKIRRKEVRRSLRAVLENEWRRLYVLTQQREQQEDGDPHGTTPPEAKQPSGKVTRERSKTREVCLARQPSTSEPDLLHFDIEWNFRPVSVTTEEARSSSGTPGQSNGTAGASNDTAGPSNVSGHLNSTSGPSDVTPNWARPPKFLQKPQFAGRRGMVGEPYVASLGPNPSPRYIHILRPTNSCREVWMRLCPPQPASSRPPRPRPTPPPQLRLVYAGGGAPCPTPTTLLLRQQPAGAHNVTIYHGPVSLGDEIEVTSLRRTNFPFSLTIYENGVATGRLSACCEHRYATGSRLGGRSGHLRVLEIIGGEPCLRCQLRVVEKRHRAGRRPPLTTTTEAAAPHHHLPPYTPPHDSGSEASSTSEANTRSVESEELASDSTSSGGRHTGNNRQPTLESEADSKTASTRTSSRDSTSSDIESVVLQDQSVVLQDQLDVRREGLAQGRRRRRVSGGSCNGPSDLEVAAALGVDTRPLEPSDEEESHHNDTSRDTSPLNTRSPSKTHMTRKTSETTINRRDRYSSSRNHSSRHSTLSTSEGKSDATNSRLSQKDSRGNRRRSSHISSSLEGQIGGQAVGRPTSHRNSISELNSRPGSSRSKRRVGSSGNQHSRREIWQNSDKVDSFYSQQKFTSSSGSDVHAVPGCATDVSYGSSWEEEDEDKEEEAENLEETDNDEAEETEEDEGNIVEKVESCEKNLGDENTDNDQDSVSGEVEDKEGTSEDEVADDEEEEVNSEDEELHQQDGSREETADDEDKVEGKSAENSVSEDVGEDSDIVQLSSSEAEVVEEDEDKESNV